MAEANEKRVQAIRRRFDKRIYIPLPDVKARQHMFKVLCLIKSEQHFIHGYFYISCAI